MSENHLVITHSEPIPEIFHSEKENKPFTSCHFCNNQFSETDNLYLIEKAYERDPKTRKPKLIFEVACCMECREEVNKSLSDESKQKIAEYFSKNSDVEKRDAELKKHNLCETDVWLHNCIVKNKSIDDVDEFQIYGLCWKDELVYHQFPYMICGDAMEDIMGLLSGKSLDLLNDLLTDLIDLPPELYEIFNTKKKVFL